jgi:UDP-glucose 4-epimerase
MPSLNLINYIKKKNNKCIFIFFSTSEIYSPIINLKKKVFPLKEKYNLIIPNKIIPRDSYFLSKLFIENFLKVSDIKYIIYRPHNIYGPRMGKSHVIPELIDKIILKKKQKVKVFSPKHKRVFCFIDDAVAQVLNSYDKKYNLNKIFNIGSSQKEINMIELARFINKFSKVKKKILPGKNTLGSPYRRVPSVKKIYKNLRNYKEVSLEKGILKTIEWYKK